LLEKTTAWAAVEIGPAKGVFPARVKAVIAESFERIHRSNLVGMGVHGRWCIKKRQSRTTLGLKGDEVFDIQIDDNLKPGQDVMVKAGTIGLSHLPNRYAGRDRITTAMAGFYRRCCDD